MPPPVQAWHIVQCYRGRASTHRVGLSLSTTISSPQEQRHRIKIHHTCGLILRSPSHQITKNKNKPQYLFCNILKCWIHLNELRWSNSPRETSTRVQRSAVLTCLEHMQGKVVKGTEKSLSSLKKHWGWTLTGRKHHPRLLVKTAGVLESDVSVTSPRPWPPTSLRWSGSYLTWARLVSALQTGHWSELTLTYLDSSRCGEILLMSRQWPLNSIVSPLKSRPVSLSSSVTVRQESIFKFILQF